MSVIKIMRKLLINILINLISFLSRNNRKIDETKDSLCIVKVESNYLMLALKNGDVIPGQLDLTIKQPFKLRGFAVVNCTFFVRFENLAK